MEPTKQKLDTYDRLIQATFINLYSYATRHDNVIQFQNFDFKNKEHLLFLSTAQQVSYLFGFKIEANIPLIKKLFNKKYLKIKKFKGSEGIIIDDYLNFMCEQQNFPRDEVSKIYDDYYKIIKQKFILRGRNKGI